mmetsp:Transcript_26458/g.81408  ORF Transcript_26458/g.81408 Transcript_26458/m.81408 type:complete len:258 (-) Transcript_26458:5-778(-)
MLWFTAACMPRQFASKRASICFSRASKRTATARPSESPSWCEARAQRSRVSRMDPSFESTAVMTPSGASMTSSCSLARGRLSPNCSMRSAGDGWPPKRVRLRRCLGEPAASFRMTRSVSRDMCQQMAQPSGRTTALHCCWPKAALLPQKSTWPCHITVGQPKSMRRWFRRRRSMALPNREADTRGSAGGKRLSRKGGTGRTRSLGGRRTSELAARAGPCLGGTRAQACNAAAGAQHREAMPQLSMHLQSRVQRCSAG